MLDDSIGLNVQVPVHPRGTDSSCEDGLPTTTTPQSWAGCSVNKGVNPSQSAGTHSVGRRRAACCLSSVEAPQIFSVGVPGMLGELGTDWLVGVTGISI